MEPPIDPAEYTVQELAAALEDIDEPEALAAIMEAERAGDDRTTAREAVQSRLRAVGSDPAEVNSRGASERLDAPGVRETLGEAFWYPWDGGDAGVTLFIGGILTLLSPLLIPGLFVIGYALRVVRAVLDGEPGPPSFGDWEAMFVDGVKGAIVLGVYVVLPLAVGTAILWAAGGRLITDTRPLVRVFPAAGIVFGLVLLLAGLALAVWYLAPAALVHLGRTRRLRAAFDFDAVRQLAASDAYGSSWLLALGVFAITAVTLAVLDAAVIGVIVSGFVTFYAIVSTANLISHGAEATGYAVEVSPDHRAPEGSEA